MAKELDKKGNVKMRAKDVAIAHDGTQIVLPVVDGKKMGYEEAIIWLKRKQEEEERVVEINFTIPCSPLDGLVAFQRVLAERYGWTAGVTKHSWFGSQPPLMVGVPTGVGEHEQAMYGTVKVPNIDGELTTRVATDPPAFILTGTIRQKHKPEIDRLVKLIEAKLREGSIYRGRAIRVDFSWDRVDPNSGKRKGYNIMSDAPSFMEIEDSLEKTLIFGERVSHALDIGLFTPIEQSDACRRYGVPLGRRVLLAGPYGTGKTLTASATAIKGTRNGWTFVYLQDVRDLKRGLEFAAQYAPAILFAEDIDRVVTGERSTSMDEILNTIDGCDTKNGEIITVFTTNHVNDINEAMLRPGRTDVLVEVEPPDADAAQRLVVLYSRGLLEEGADLSILGERLAGKIPAIIREVVERGKIAAISRLNGGDIEGNVTSADLLSAVDAMDNHNRLLWKEGEEIVSSPEVLVRIPENSAEGKALLKQIVGNTVAGVPKAAAKTAQG